MKIRRILGALLLMGSFFFFSASPAQAKDVKKNNEEMEKCVQQAITDQTDAIDCAKSPKLILPATNEVIWGGAAFVLLMLLMYKKAFPMVKQGMDARTEKIRNDIDEAERKNAEANTVLADYKSKLNDAKVEANRIIEEAKQTAEAMRKDLVARAEKDAAELRERNQAEINASKERTMVDLRADVTAMAIELAEKVVEKNLDKATNSKLIDQYIAQVGAGK